MKKYGKDSLKLILFLALGIFFVWYSLKDLSTQQRSMILVYAKDVGQGYRWIYLALCAFIGFLSVVFRGLRSVLMIEPLGYKPSKLNSYHAVMIAYLANFAFPRLGELLRCSILQRYEKVPFQKSLGTVITERVIDMLIFGSFILLLIFTSDKLASLFSENTITDRILLMLTGAGKYIVAISLLAMLLIAFFLRNIITELPLFKKFSAILKGFRDGLLSIKYIKKQGLFLMYSFLIWLCYYLMFYVCTFAFTELLPDSLNMGDIFSASLLCVAVGSLGFMIAQGGLGAYPLLVSSALLLYGVPEEAGLAMGWVIWTTESLMYIVLGLLSLLLLSFQKDRKTSVT
jgi:uncharacterized protein (TIRG00374 family)